MEKLSLTWYYDTPFDLEQKQYIILDYIQKTEKKFINREVSPHLLHLEKMIFDMKNFKKTLNCFVNEVNRSDYEFLFPSIYKLKNVYIDEMVELIDFSTPRMELVINLGKNISAKYNLVLF